jgi:hypothetical protein
MGRRVCIPNPAEHSSWNRFVRQLIDARNVKRMKDGRSSVANAAPVLHYALAIG